MRHLVIHCGGPKTGSSALQFALGTHPEALAAHGIAYPMLARPQDPKRPSLGNAHTIARMWTEQKPAPDGGNILRKRAAAVRRDARLSPAEAIVLSSEYFSALDLRDWKRTLIFLRPIGATVTTVTYFRNQVEQIHSYLGQAIKRGARPEVAAFVEDTLARAPFLAAHAYWRRAQRLSGARPIVAAYDRRSLPDGTITADFLARLADITGRPAPAMAAAVEINPSYTAEALRLKHALNAAGLSSVENILVMRLFQNVPEFRAAPERPEITLPEPMAERIREHFAADNARARTAFGEAFATLARALPTGTAFVDPTAPPSARTRALFWHHWHEVDRAADATRAAAMDALAPRLRAALGEGTTAPVSA